MLPSAQDSVAPKRIDQISRRKERKINLESNAQCTAAQQVYTGRDVKASDRAKYYHYMRGQSKKRRKTQSVLWIDGSYVSINSVEY
jgi:hypothetical protein